MPAIKISDLNNAKVDIDFIGEFATSEDETAIDRMGRTRRTLAGVEAYISDHGILAESLAAQAGAEAYAVSAATASQVALARGKTYPTPAAGVDAGGTPPGVGFGEYFTVPSPSSRDSLDLYRNVGGAAVLQVGKSIPAADAVNKPSQSGKVNGWPDLFFRRSAFGESFLGRRRYFEYTPGNFSGYQLVPNPAFDGYAVRRVIDGTTIPAGPLIWLDELGAGEGDTVTVYILVSSANAGTAYGAGRFLGEAFNGLGTQINMQRSTGELGVIASAIPQFLRLSEVVPPGAKSIGIFHYSQTAGARPEMVACWAFKGGVAAGPAWPVFDETTWLTLRGEQQQATIVAQAAQLTAANTKILQLEKSSPAKGLRELKLALCNPLCQFNGVVLIGDSITFGLTTTGQNPIQPMPPRNGTLADARNNGASPSWANLLHKYLGLQYYNDSSATESAWPGTPSGVAIFEYSDSVDLFPGYDPFIRSNTNAVAPVGLWNQVYSPTTKLGFYVQGNVASSQDNMRLSWTMTGYEFDLVFAAQANGAKYELIVNGVTLGTYSTQTGDTGLPVSFGNVRTHALGGFKRDALVELRLVPGDGARYNFRVEAITINRKLRVTNQGIIGITAAKYVDTDMVAAACQEGDQFAIVQLGTNDRAILSSYGRPESPSTLRYNMDRIADALAVMEVQPVVMCANAVPAVVDVPPTYRYGMAKVREALRQFADDRKFDFIDHFASTRALFAAGDTAWCEPAGPHPFDAGHLLMFNNIKERLDAA
ncbi:SGNH/GDSL hydrolase family protein [Variovorax sp. EBFNA2]|uniref:SGNH/GDSL hydrolase family protein n=1 Tax=Variovorax sp. EBFNA2 TaxID=3342097 RepID=UPI0029C0E79F|nr:SGNH/GDSL hydrolase family protein [Variovorax boronicumulans]WPG35125.1 SGNH/GDSL hydrolase family protein [Variovorax boronicumulans]